MTEGINFGKDAFHEGRLQQLGLWVVDLGRMGNAKGGG